ncbi:MAG TPA: BatA and WFA domain-containing protein [Bacillales bacterium]|nr:BatA and WFA domain-containing protein [Bacillales bacterium]
MGFFSPVSFWFLSFIGILILFYFFKKQFDRRPVSSVYLWEQTVKEWETNRWWKRLQRSLLLLLQILVMLFLIFALSRPYVFGKGVSGDHLVIVIDTSASMAVHEDNGTRFKQAKEKALALLDQLTDDQAVTLIAAKRVPDLLEAKTNDHDRVSKEIHSLKLSYQHADLNDSVRLAESLAGAHGEIHVFTDQLRQKQLDDLEIEAKTSVHNIGTSRPNLSMKTFGVRVVGNRVSAVVTVKNEGNGAKDAVVAIYHDGKRLKQVEKNVPAGKQVTMTIKGLPKQTVYTAQIEAKDAYPLDNHRWAFLSDESPQTLYLAGAVNPFLTKALQYTGAEIVQIPKNEKGNYRFPENAGNEVVYILADVPADEWPKGAKLIISPGLGGPFQIGKKVSLKYQLKITQNDPMMQYVNVEKVYLGKAYSLGKDLMGFTPLIISGDMPVVSKGRFQGAKTVLFSFDIQDSDWPLHPSFPILVQNTLAYLTNHDETLGYLFPGERKKISLAPTTRSAKIETAKGQDISDLNLKNPMLKAPDQPGLYKLVEQTGNGLRTRYFAVMADTRELTVQAVESFSLVQENPNESVDGTNIVKKGLWRWAAAFALLMLFVEWEVYRRGITGR